MTRKGTDPLLDVTVPTDTTGVRQSRIYMFGKTCHGHAPECRQLASGEWGPTVCMLCKLVLNDFGGIYEKATAFEHEKIKKDFH